MKPRKVSHPGEVLRARYLEPFKLSCNAVAHELRVPAGRIAEIVKGKRSVTADTALRFAKFFGTKPEFWMDLQRDFDLATTERRLEEEALLECIVPRK
jgi:antitoxin HigA-1